MSNPIKITSMAASLSIAFWSGCTFQSESAAIRGSNLKSDKSEMTELEKNESVNQNDVYISFSAVDSRMVLHQPVIIDFKVKNELNQSVELDLGPNRKEGFIFTLVLPSGQEVKLPQLKRDGFSISGITLINPNEIYSQKLILNEWTDFASEGNYTLKARLANKVQAADGKSVHFKSAFISEFNIEGENSDRLRIVCEELIQQLFESNSYADAAQSALTLSYVKDPVSVPYLQKALASEKMVESVIINSLRESGGLESVEVLIDAMNKKPNSDLAVQAKSALNWIDTHTSDATVKATIREALSRKRP